MFASSGEKSIKVVLLGNEKVGKGNLIHRFSSNTFSKDNPYSSGSHTCDYAFHEVVSLGVNDKFQVSEGDLYKRNLKFNIYEHPGARRRPDAAYWRGVDVAILVYDVTDHQSFLDIAKWKGNEIDNYCPDAVRLILIGNKCDAEADRVITQEQGQQLARELKIPFFLETSAKSNTNVTELFLTIAKNIFQQEVKSESKSHKTITEKDALALAWSLSNLEQRNNVVKQWLAIPGNNLKTHSWSLLRAESLIILDQLVSAKSSQDGLGLLKKALGYELFNTHRKGLFGSTGAVQTIKAKIEKLNTIIARENTIIAREKKSDTLAAEIAKAKSDALEGYTKKKLRTI